VSYISKRVREDYLTSERPPVSLVIDLIIADIEAFNKANTIKLEPPSDSKVRNWLNRNVTDYERVFWREGPKAAEQKFRHVHRTVPGLMPLQTVELDHQKLDLQSIWDIVTQGKDKRRKHVRTVRAWLTLAICTVTRMVVGWHIAMEAPSWTSVMACLQMMMTVKRPEDYGATSDYPATGVPQTLKMDNGKELQSFSLKLMAADAGIAIEYCPRAKPHLKPYIERLNGTISRDFLADMPGKTFHNTVEKGDYDSEARAAYTVKELKERFGKYIIDVYHNRKHAGLLNMSPLEKWRSMSSMGVRVPPKYSDIRAMTGKVLHSKITNKGVQFKGLFYQDDDLQALRKTARQEGKDYTIKIDPLDISQIMVLDDINGKWISVKCNDPTVREGLTLVEHEEHVAISKAQTADKMRVPMERMRAARREMHDETKSRRVRDARATQRDLSVHRHEMEPVLDVTPTDEMPGQTYHDEAKKNRHAEMRQAEHTKSLGHVENHQAEPSSNDNHPTELNEMTLGESDHD
jgi:putative transposase